jgi:cytidyltransferase-like protein
MQSILVSGSFDDMRSRHIRFLQAASQLGEVQVWLWSDETVRAQTGQPPKFPAEERLYLLQANRFVSRAAIAPEGAVWPLPNLDEAQPAIWAVEAIESDAQKQAYCKLHGWGYRVFSTDDLKGFPEIPLISQTQTPDGQTSTPGRKKVIVTGCYDWFHSGHVRFFEEASALGDLYVVAGSDQNVRLLKGDGHPLFPEAERRYVIQAVRYVKQALISSGQGWMDAEPEIARLKPDIYAVNEDGDRPEKREFCRQHGLEYVVLKRLPKPGLPRRQSTDLRGF